MKSKPLFALLLVAMLFGFGSQWNCICVLEDEHKHGSVTPPPPPPSYGCVDRTNFSIGAPAPNEYTVIVGVFGHHEYGQAIELAGCLRKDRIRNFLYQTDEGKWVVAVGRYYNEQRAEQMKRVIQSKGYPHAHVRLPKGYEQHIEPHPPAGGCS